MPEPRAARPQTQTTIAGAISKEAVRIVAAHTGRGPTKVRTFINDDVVTIVARDLLTPGERSLADGGRADPVLAVRQAHQEAMRAELSAAVHELTGRAVIAFLSANHLDPDIEVETFILEAD